MAVFGEKDKLLVVSWYKKGVKHHLLWLLFLVWMLPIVSCYGVWYHGFMAPIVWNDRILL